jgi:hypothetical protein
MPPNKVFTFVASVIHCLMTPNPMPNKILMRSPSFYFTLYKKLTLNWLQTFRKLQNCSEPCTWPYIPGESTFITTAVRTSDPTNNYLFACWVLTSVDVAVSFEVGKLSYAKLKRTDLFFQGMHLVMFISISFLYIRQHNNKINSLPHLCQLSLFNLRYSYATCFGCQGAIIRRYTIYKPWNIEL